MDMIHFTVAHDMAGSRLDKFLAAACADLSRSRVQALIASGDVSVDGAAAGASLKLKAGQRIALRVPEAVDPDPVAQEIALDIVYEDDDLLVINKPAGMVVHPGAGNGDGTLVNALLHHCGDSLSGIGGVKRPGIVHRLDKDTSGLMIVAKHDKAHRFLSEQLSDRSLSRTYHALCWGAPEPRVGMVNLPLGRHPQDRQRMTIRRRGGRDALTRYRAIATFGAPEAAASLVECRLETGRTHQIRVHMQSINHCVVGDPVYGAPQTLRKALVKRGGLGDEAAAGLLGFPRQALHAHAIRFIHPRDEEEMSFSAPVPPDFQAILDVLEQNGDVRTFV